MRMEVMKKQDNYGSALIISVLVLFGLMLGVLYKIQQSKEEEVIPTIKKHHGFMVPPTDRSEKLYILSSKETAKFYMQHGSFAEEYAKKVRDFSDFLSSIGYQTEIVPMGKVTTLKKDAIAFVVDAQVLSAKDKSAIKHFIQNGGKLFFNFIAGFTDEKGKYQGDSFVKSITKLTLSPKGFASFKEGLSLTPKLLSAFSSYIKVGKLLSVALYDKLPIYINTLGENADIFATAYDQVTPPITKDMTKSFTNNEAAVAWHGYLGEGKWVYTSLPSYSFYDIKESRESYKKLLAGMVDFLSKKVEVALYPYIDQSSVVFVSEDTEYKFENFQKFADLSKEYKVPVTAFIVASLANLPEHKAMMAHIKQNPYVEFASHSTTHTKIVGESEKFIKNETAHSKILIDPFAPQPITGFRPPREELNAMMKKYLASSGFTYVLGANESYLYPKVDKVESNLFYIPRHGTDDYSYLVNLDWDQKEIVKQMEKEAAFVTNLNGIYTLSVHTHLFAYSSNIEIIRAFYEYLKQHPELKPLQGRQIIQRINARNHIDYSSKMVGNELVVTLTNSADEALKNLHIKLFKNPLLKIKSGRVSDGLNVTLYEKDDVIMIDAIPASSTVMLYISLES